jgi:nitrogen regulatory protein PII 2
MKETNMQEIMAIIRMNKINATKLALSDMGIASMSARKVMGRGIGKVDYQILKGAEEGYEEAINHLGPGPKLIPKRLLLVVVPDGRVEAVVKTIVEINQTGNSGDGKIFVLPVLDAVRVRTGESGELAIDENAA